MSELIANIGVVFLIINCLTGLLVNCYLLFRLGSKLGTFLVDSFSGTKG